MVPGVVTPICREMNPAIAEANERANAILYIPRHLREPSAPAGVPKALRVAGGGGWPSRQATGAK